MKLVVPISGSKCSTQEVITQYQKTISIYVLSTLATFEGHVGIHRVLNGQKVWAWE